MDVATIGCEIGRVDDEPVYLRLQSARNDGAEGEGAEPVISMPVMPFNTWQVVKRRIKERWPGLKAVPDMNIRLLHKSVELRNGSMVADYNMQGGDRAERPVELQYLIIDQGHEHEQKGARSIGLYVDAQVHFFCTQNLKDRVHASLAALLSGIQPRLTDEGTGATYMLRDSSNRHIIAVFKPKDEEAFAPQNPRGYVGAENSTGLRQGVLSTQQAAREVAAYLLDHENFAGVPETTLVHSKHPKFVQCRGKVVWKIGAFQAFIETKDTAGNFAPQVFGTADVHRIGILDIRIVNLDRNDGNLLVRRGRGSARYELVPIDHGLSMPDRLEVFTDDIAWMSWPQAHKPFGEAELEYIKTLNGTRDARLLAKYLGVRRDCLRLMEVTTRLLQIGAEFGLTLFEIGSVIYREDRGSDVPAQPSKLEQIIESCLDSALAVAGDGTAASSTSATLLGLDLQNTSASRLGTGRMLRQVSAGDGPERLLGLTPQLRPSSPLASPLSTSPNGGAGVDAPTQPPHLSLDGLDDSDSPHSPEAAVPPFSGVMADRGEDGRMGEEGAMPAASKKSAKSFRGTYKAGRSTLRGRTSAALAHQQGEGKDNQGSIFERPHLQGADWPPELEKAFRRHINAELTEYIRKAFRRPAAPEAGSAPAEEPPERDAAAEAAPPPPREVFSLASALPRVMPPDRPFFASPEPAAAEPPAAGGQAGGGQQPVRQLYVPPHLRRATAEAKASGGGSPGAEGGGGSPAGADGCPAAGEAQASPEPEAADEAAAPAPEPAAARPRYEPPQRRAAAAEAAAEQPEGGASEEPPRPKYVPPFMRKAAERAAAEAAAAGAAAEADAGVAAVTSPTSQSASSTALPSDAAWGNARYGICVNQGPRASMEDAVDAVAQMEGTIPSEFYAVYDGHSGTEAVKFVQRHLPAKISSREGFGDPSRIDEVLHEAFTLTDEELLKHIQSHGRSQTNGGLSEGTYVLSSGCVGCCAIVRGKDVIVANLGDCRALMCSQGEITPLTVDHRAVADVNESERERLKEMQVEVSSDGYLHGRIGVSRAFGDWAWDAEEKCRGLLCKPEVSKAEVTDDTEFLLLACDGVFENMTTKEAGQIVRRSLRSMRAAGDAKAAAEAVVKHAVKRNGSDNVSAVVVLFKCPPADAQRAAPRLFGRGLPAAPPDEPAPSAEAGS